LPTAPGYTLTQTLEDITGAAAGSTANPAKLRICLCGFGPFLPYIAGTTLLAKVGPMDFYSTGAPIDMTLFGNDQITPAGTYYTIEVLDGEDNVVQCGAYVLSGNGSGGLPPPIVPPPAPQPAGLAMVQLGGTVPGTAFTLPTPAYGGVIIGIWYRGTFYPAAGNWSLAGLTVTMTFACTQEPYALYMQAIA
jgi:hypothetical protein